MAATLIDGKKTSAAIRAELADRIAHFSTSYGRAPGLTAVLVGDNPASRVYVRNKQKACQAVGLHGVVKQLPDSLREADLLQVVDELNAAPDVDGILVQLPLPTQISVDRVIEAIQPDKDVDGFHPENLGLLVAGRPRFVPCTPLGVQELLKRHGVEVRGRKVVILGRSNIVGKPLALLLMQKGEAADATVTVCHSATQDTVEIVREADIVIAAVGKRQMVKRDWIKPGAVVIDVGIHRNEDRSLSGDVDFDQVAEVASQITPVPGGVGPMTIAMLLANTMKAAELRERSQ